MQTAPLFEAFCLVHGARSPGVNPIVGDCLVFVLMIIDGCKMHAVSYKVHGCFAPYLVLFGDQGMGLWHLFLKAVLYESEHV